MAKKELKGAYRCHIFILVYNLEFIKRFGEFRHMRYKKNNADQQSHSSPQYSAFIHPISANKPILSTLKVGFIPSTTQSASPKYNAQKAQAYRITHSHTY